MANERLTDISAPPSDASMENAIGPLIVEAWIALRRFLAETYAIDPVLQYGGKRYGWNLQHRKGGRPLCEIYPECGSFTALVVLGRRELEEAMAALETFGPNVRQALESTPRYHDGCWLYIRIADPRTCRRDEQDVEQLILFKKKPPRQRNPPPTD